MKAYGYIRVSTDRQSENGESLPTQKRQIEGYAMQQGWTLESVFVEKGVSGFKPLQDRPQGSELLKTVGAGDVIITPKLDRMFRNARNALDVLADLQSREVHLHMIDLGGDVTGDGHAKLVFTILSAVAEAERDRIKERISDVKADQKARGRYLGGIVPFGYRAISNGKGKRLKPVEKEQTAIKRIRRLRREGKSLRAIAEDMQKRGHKLSHEGVKRILSRKG